MDLSYFTIRLTIQHSAEKSWFIPCNEGESKTDICNIWSNGHIQSLGLLNFILILQDSYEFFYKLNLYAHSLRSEQTSLIL